MVPYCRNAAFTGRKGILESMTGLFRSGEHNRVVLHGLGGCGKTQLALEYVHQRASESPCNVFWVQGSGALQFSHGFRAIAQLAGIPLVDPDNYGEGNLRSVRTWFEGPDSGDWILIIDNADNEADFFDKTSPISKFVPQGPRGAVVFTTRSKQVAVRQGCRIIEIDKMPAEEALDLFSKRFGGWGTLEDEEKRTVATILDSMGNLPLAVVGAAAFMTENGTSPSVYQNILGDNDDRTKALLSQRLCDIQREADMTESILSTYFITFDRIAQQMPPAAELLRLIAFCDRQNIPQQLLTDSGVEGMDDSLKFSEAIGKLLRLALVSEVKQEGTTFYELHRLVQLSIQAYLPIAHAQKGKAAALHAISRLFPEYEYKRRHIYAVYMSHALLLTKDSREPIAEELAYRMGRHFMEMGSYNDAEIQARRCIALRDADEEGGWEGDIHSRIMLVGRASLGRGTGKEAQMMFRQVLEGYKKDLGPDHPNTLIAANDLVVLLRIQGRHEESELMNWRKLDGYEGALGSDGVSTLIAISILAIVIEEQGRHEESEVMERRALEGFKKALGPDHPHTLMTTNNLAVMLRKHGRYEESEVMNRRALEGFEKVLGSDHVDTLLAVYNLATLLEKQGRYKESEAFAQRAFEGNGKALGSHHPGTLASAHCLATAREGLVGMKKSEDEARNGKFEIRRKLGDLRRWARRVLPI